MAIAGEQRIDAAADAQAGTDARGRVRRKKQSAFAGFLRRRWTLPVLSVVVFLILWQIVGSNINPILLATPGSVAISLWDLIVNGTLTFAFLRAMGSLATGFAIAAVVGIGVGLLMGRSQVAYRVINPYVSFFQATPLIALTPLVVIWTGIGFTAEVTITFLLAVWTVIINTAEGTKSTPPILLDMANVYHATESSIVRNVALPNAVPYIFAGLRIALGKALIGVIIGEMSISLKGLGGLIVNFGDAFQTASLLASILTSSIVGVIGTILLELLRRRIAPWAARPDDRTKI